MEATTEPTCKRFTLYDQERPKIENVKSIALALGVVTAIVIMWTGNFWAVLTYFGIGYINQLLIYSALAIGFPAYYINKDGGLKFNLSTICGLICMYIGVKYLFHAITLWVVLKLFEIITYLSLIHQIYS